MCKERARPPEAAESLRPSPWGPPRPAGEWLARTKEAGWKCGIRAHLWDILSPRVPADLKQRYLRSGVDEEYKNSAPGQAYWKARV